MLKKPIPLPYVSHVLYWFIICVQNSKTNNMIYDSDVVVVPMIKLNPCQVTAYNSIELNGRAYRSTKQSILNLKSNQHHNRFSTKSSNKLYRAIDYLMFSASVKFGYNRNTYNMVKYRLVFVTLTLPSKQAHTDNIIKKELLNHLLVLLRSKYHCNQYVWRMEKQLNGNVHFHIVTDNFIPHSELRNDWNRIINKLGYVDRYKTNQIIWHSSGFTPRTELLKTWPMDKQLAAFKRGVQCQWSNPNTTDIHSLKLIVNIKNYLCKYLVKTERDIKQINIQDSLTKTKKILIGISSVSTGAKKFLRKESGIGRLWGCSEKLSKAKGIVDVREGKYTDELNRLATKPGVKKCSHEYHSTLYFKFLILYKYKCTALIALFSGYIYDLFGIDLSKFIMF